MSKVESRDARGFAERARRRFVTSLNMAPAACLACSESRHQTVRIRHFTPPEGGTPNRLPGEEATRCLWKIVFSRRVGGFVAKQSASVRLAHQEGRPKIASYLVGSSNYRVKRVTTRLHAARMESKARSSGPTSEVANQPTLETSSRASGLDPSAKVAVKNRSRVG